MVLERLAPNTLERARSAMINFCRCAGRYISFLVSAKSTQDQGQLSGVDQTYVDDIFALAVELSEVQGSTLSPNFFPVASSHFVTAFHRSWCSRSSSVCLAIASDLSAHLLIKQHRERVPLIADGSYARRSAMVWSQLGASRQQLKRQLNNVSSQISEKLGHNVQNVPTF